MEAIGLAKKVGEEQRGRPVTMLGYLVHNEHATRELEAAGVRLVAEPDRMKGLEQVTEGTVIFTPRHLPSGRRGRPGGGA